MFRCYIIIFSLLIAQSALSKDTTQKMYIAYHELCPSMCNDKSVSVVDIIIKKVFQDENIEVIFITLPQLRIMRDIRIGQSGSQILHATITTKTQLPDFLFPDTPIAKDKLCFYTTTSTKWVYHPDGKNNKINLSLFNGAKYPAIYGFISELEKLGMLTVISGNFETLVNMMIRDRVEAIYDISSSVKYAAKKLNKLHLVKKGWCQPTYLEGFIAFSPAYDKQAKNWIEIWDRKYPKLLSMGEFDDLIESNGLYKPFKN